MRFDPLRIYDRLAPLGAVCAGAVLAVMAAGPALGSGGVEPFEITARAVPLDSENPKRDIVGRLKFMGGLSLSASDKRFGGLSGILWESECGRLLAVSDTGNWVAIEPEESADHLIGIESAWMAPVLDRQGTPPVSKHLADAESLARSADGATWVFFEQDHRGLRFPDLNGCRPESLSTAPDTEWRPPETKGWGGNDSLEAVTFLGKNLTLVTENVLTEGGRLGLIGPVEGPTLRFAWDAPRGFAPTAMDTLDPGEENGRALILHRRLSFPAGFSAVLMEATIPAQPGATVQGKEIARLQAPLATDNMEGIAVRADGDRRFIYMISDDNFMALQRTLLLKFELLPE